MPSDPIGVFGRVVQVLGSTGTDETLHPLLPPDPRLRTGLATFLCFLVPLAIEEQRHLSSERIDSMREELVDTIAAHGDDVQFGGTHQKSGRVALAKAIALLATAEGGVTILGVHACTAEHEGCPGIKSEGPPPGLSRDSQPTNPLERATWKAGAALRRLVPETTSALVDLSGEYVRLISIFADETEINPADDTGPFDTETLGEADGILRQGLNEASPSALDAAGWQHVPDRQTDHLYRIIFPAARQ